jgi:hypothetical protein
MYVFLKKMELNTNRFGDLIRETPAPNN